MPAPGDQHTAWANPFEEGKPRESEWTQSEISAISSKLDKQLGPEYISARSGPGGMRVHYLAAEKVITLANEVFGFNGWSSSIQNIQVDFADENPQTQKVSIGLSVIVRVTLRDGTYHEDIGYGSIENARNKAMAFEKAKKEGTTDGLKRALRSFGSVLGNCVYDQEYLKQVTKIKVPPSKKFSADNLHRHADFAKKEVVKTEKPEPVNNPAPPAAFKLEAEDSFDDFFGELDSADFCVPGEGHPDEVMLSNLPPNVDLVSAPPQPGRAPYKPASVSTDNRPPQTPNHGQKRPSPPAATHVAPMSRPALGAQPRPSGHNPPAVHNPAAAQQNNASVSVGFFSAKAVKDLPASALEDESSTQFAMPRGNQLFNPKLESPSIPKTPGIDHSSSKPLSRNGQHVAPTLSQSSGPEAKTGGFTPVRPSAAPPARGAVLNQSLDQTRRIGAPGAPGSPLTNRSQYRPPTMKRTLPGEAGGAGQQQRSPLQELPANGGGNANTTVTDGLEAKRQKVL